MTLTGKGVLVTGASGFIGGALVKRLLTMNVHVRGLVRSAEKGTRIAHLGAEVVTGNLLDADSLRRAVAGVEVVFHVAAAMGGPAAVQYAINVGGVDRLLTAAAEAGVRRIVHVSTIAVYGYHVPDVITEDVPLCPGSEYYGQSKALGERLLWQRAAEGGFEAAVIRPGMVYGPGSNFWTAGMFRLARRRPAFLPGSGATYCPAIFIDDVVDLMITAADHPRAAGEAFNATPDPPPTWRDFLGAYAAMAGHQSFVSVPVPLLRAAAVLIEPVLAWHGEPQPVRDMVAAMFGHKRVYSMAKAARLLNWRPRMSLAEGMARAEVWLREIGLLTGKTGR